MMAHALDKLRLREFGCIGMRIFLLGSIIDSICSGSPRDSGPNSRMSLSSNVASLC